MSRRAIELIVATTSLAFIAACGGKGGGNFQPVDGATAQDAGQAMGDSAESSAGSFGSANGPMAANPCSSGSVSASPTQPSDMDGDHVPDTFTVTFTNCALVGTNGTETINGTEQIVDGTPATADYDFTATYALNLDLVGAGAHAGEAGTVNLTGTREAHGQAGGTSFTIADSTSVDETVTAPSSHHITDSKAWNVTYSPSTSWTPGTAPVAGGLQISGSWSVHVDDKGANAQMSSTGLQVDPACETHIVAGSLTASYAATNGQTATITTTWNGCGNRTVVYNGP